MKKYLLIILTLLLFLSCTKLTINSANSKAAHNDYYSGIGILDEKIRKDYTNQELVKSYEKIFNKGEEYYNSVNKLEDLYLMEELYLDLPQNVKNVLTDIVLNEKKHKSIGETVAKNYLQEANVISENSYKNKVKKYNLLQRISIFDRNLANKIKIDLDKVYSKIEKTYKPQIKSNDYDLSASIEKYIYSGQGRVFKYSNSNPDMRLEIDLNVLSYYPASINMQPFPKQYTEVYKDENGKEAVNVVKYYENRFTKKTGMRVNFSYRIVSNLTGEVIISGAKQFNKNYEEKWKTYYLLSNRVMNANKVPKDEVEKGVPKKNQIVEEITNNIFELINSDLAQLPAYK